MRRTAIAYWLAMKLGGLSLGQLSAIAAFVFFAFYLPISLTFALTGRYLHALDTMAVLFFVACALVTSVVLAVVRLPSYRLSERLRRRENLAWMSMAVFVFALLVGRSIYAYREMTAQSYGGDPIPIADMIFGSSFLLLVAAMVLIPWVDKDSPSRSLKLDTAIVMVAIATLFWPLIIGPAVQRELNVTVSDQTLISYLGGIVLMTAIIFWIIARDVRTELWPTAVSFLLAILAMVVTQLSYIAFMQQEGVPAIQLLTINASTALSAVFLATAGILRLQSVLKREVIEVSRLSSDEAPVRIWQIILPYPLIAVLIMLRLGMEIFDFRTDFRTGMIVGIAAIIFMMMYRQIQMLDYNNTLYHKVAHSAIRDGLTGLFNHRAMHDSLHAEVARMRRQNGDLAIYFIDIDHFKRLNDTYGHKQGDRVLVMVADQLLKACRAGDTVGRYGGEEFMIIAPGIDCEYAERIGERLRKQVASLEFIFSGDRVGVTASVGIAVYPADSDDPEALIDLADQAMYSAKDAGRDRTVLYRDSS